MNVSSSAPERVIKFHCSYFNSKKMSRNFQRNENENVSGRCRHMRTGKILTSCPDFYETVEKKRGSYHATT